MKKLAFLLIFLSVTRIGVAYAEESVGNITGSYFFGTSTSGAADVVNGVLALLIGPQGEPGLLGPAGKSAFEVAKQNGFTGTESQWVASLVGSDGKSAFEVARANGFTGTESEWIRSLFGPPGPSGATGSAGVAGTGVTVVAEPSGANCTNGGYRLTSSTGVSYVCNGSNGTGGGSGGGSVGYGVGEVSIGACTDTATVGVKAQFNGSDFVMENITVSGLQAGCENKTFNFYYAIDTNTATVLKNPSGLYTHGDRIKCTLGTNTSDNPAVKIPLSTGWLNSTPQLTINSSNSYCRVIGGSTDFELDKISTADYTNKIAFEILGT
jgi:hypothetical protein